MNAVIQNRVEVAVDQGQSRYQVIQGWQIGNTAFGLVMLRTIGSNDTDLIQYGPGEVLHLPLHQVFYIRIIQEGEK